MAKPLVHSRTEQALQAFVAAPSHSVVIIGKEGAGKQTIATQLAAQLLSAEEGKLDNHPFFMLAGDIDTTISIDTIRDVQHFLSRKTATNSTMPINRAVVIANAERLTLEAQNAFLKTLEEPSTGTVLILTVSDKARLLPTIMSRLRSIELVTPEAQQVREYFSSLYTSGDIERALLMSGGLPGLMTAILAGNKEHALVQAADTARNILRLDTFGRLALIDSLAKQRQSCMDICYILQQMAEVSLVTASKASSAYEQWRTILRAAHEAQEALLAQAQTKLVLCRLMLSL